MISMGAARDELGYACIACDEHVCSSCLRLRRRRITRHDVDLTRAGVIIAQRASLAHKSRLSSLRNHRIGRPSFNACCTLPLPPPEFRQRLCTPAGDDRCLCLGLTTRAADSDCHAALSTWSQSSRKIPWQRDRLSAYFDRTSCLISSATASLNSVGASSRGGLCWSLGLWDEGGVRHASLKQR